MSVLADLIERLEKAAGPDRDTDADIYIAFNIPAERAGRIDRLGGCVGWWPKDAPYVSAVDVPSYTASLDAAVVLSESVAPGRLWHLMTAALKSWSISDGLPADLPRFYLLALLRALQQEEKR